MNIAIKPQNSETRRALLGKVSVVTGSTSGIGLGIARALAAAGSEIVLNGLGDPRAIADVQAKVASEFSVPGVLLARGHVEARGDPGDDR